MDVALVAWRTEIGPPDQVVQKGLPHGLGLGMSVRPPSARVEAARRDISLEV
jgi:hypothetical protein